MRERISNQILPFFKLLFLCILIIGPFAGYYLGLTHQKTALTPAEEPATEKNVSGDTYKTADTETIGSIEESFINSNFRVLKVIKNPTAPSYLIIATEKSEVTCGSKEVPSRCVNDTGCGGMYVSPTCYFFEEPDFVYGANPNTRFMGKYEGYAVDLESFVFKDSNTIEFSAGFGDAGYGIVTRNIFDLSTGQTEELSKEEFTSELP